MAALFLRNQLDGLRNLVATSEQFWTEMGLTVANGVGVNQPLALANVYAPGQPFPRDTQGRTTEPPLPFAMVSPALEGGWSFQRSTGEWTQPLTAYFELRFNIELATNWSAAVGDALERIGTILCADFYARAESFSLLQDTWTVTDVSWPDREKLGDTGKDALRVMFRLEGV